MSWRTAGAAGAAAGAAAEAAAATATAAAAGAATGAAAAGNRPTVRPARLPIPSGEAGPFSSHESRWLEREVRQAFQPDLRKRRVRLESLTYGRRTTMMPAIGYGVR